MWSQGSVVPSYSKVTGLKEIGKSSYVLRERHSPNSHRFLPYIPLYFSEFSLKVFQPLRQLIICTFVSMRGGKRLSPSSTRDLSIFLSSWPSREARGVGRRGKLFRRGSSAAGCFPMVRYTVASINSSNCARVRTTISSSRPLSGWGGRIGTDLVTSIPPGSFFQNS